MGLRQYLAEGAGCEVSFCCFDGFAEGCDRALGFDFCFGLGACCSFFLEGGRQLDDDVGIGNHLFGEHVFGEVATDRSNLEAGIFGGCRCRGTWESCGFLSLLCPC